MECWKKHFICLKTKCKLKAREIIQKIVFAKNKCDSEQTPKVSCFALSVNDYIDKYIHWLLRLALTQQT